MRTLIIYGSPNKDHSFTMELLKKVEPDFLDNSIFFDCFDASPKPCDGCGFSKKADNCKYADLNSFFDNFKAASRVIIAFPVYNGSFPSPMKALFDRFQQFYNARFFKNKQPPIKGIREVTLVMTAGSKNDPLPIILAQLKPIFTVCGCRLKKAVMLMGTDDEPILKTVEF